MKRSEGQVRGVVKMMEEEKDCESIITQLLAVRSSVDKVIALMVANNLINTLQQDENQEIKIQEAVNLLLKSR